MFISKGPAIRVLRASQGRSLKAWRVWRRSRGDYRWADGGRSVGRLCRQSADTSMDSRSPGQRLLRKMIEVITARGWLGFRRRFRAGRGCRSRRDWAGSLERRGRRDRHRRGRHGDRRKEHERPDRAPRDRERAPGRSEAAAGAARGDTEGRPRGTAQTLGRIQLLALERAERRVRRQMDGCRERPRPRLARDDRRASRSRRAPRARLPPGSSRGP